jgi:hypothetical protein
MTKTIAEIEADIAALNKQKDDLVQAKKAAVRPRLDEIKAQLEALFAEAVKLIDENNIVDFDVIVKKSGSRYETPTRLAYNYGTFGASGDSWDSGWDSSSANC